jgi:hypothetical protein
MQQKETSFECLWRDDDAEASAEEFLLQATSGEDVGEDARDEVVEEELGGPYFQIFMPFESDEDGAS